MAYLAILRPRNGFHVVRPFHPGSNVARPTLPVPGERANLVEIEPLSFRLAHRLPSFSLFPGFRASPEDTDRPPRATPGTRRETELRGPVLHVEVETVARVSRDVIWLLSQVRVISSELPIAAHATAAPAVHVGALTLAVAEPFS